MRAKKILAATALGAAASLVGAGLAVADTVTADGDGVTSSNNYVVTDCAAGASRVASTSFGVVALAGTGNGTTNTNTHFRPGTNVTFSSTPSALATSAGITSAVASPTTVFLPSSGNTNNWNNDHGVITKTISASVPAGVSSGTYGITVTVSGTNDNGGGPLSLSSSYSVVVSCSDTTGPVLTLPGNQLLEAMSASGAPLTYSATATDDVDGPVTPSCSPASGSTFPFGATTVACSATDVAGNTTSGAFTVTVRDTTAPVVTTPGTQTAEATGPSGAAVTYPAATATDLVDGSVSATCLPTSGSTFALGNTTVTCTATDSATNTGSATFTVSVGDSTPPVVTVPADQTLEATGPAGAAYTYSPAPSATDAVAGTPAVTCVPPSGSTFAITTTTVTCSASDGVQTGSSDFTVTVQDTLPPVLSGVPATQTLEATSAAGAALGALAPTAADVVDGARTVVCTNDDDGDSIVTAATSYPLDATTHVTCAASDTRGNVGTGTYEVTVQDTTGPVLEDLDNVGPLEATGPSGSTASYSITALDAVDGIVYAVCTPASGSTFALGASAVSCTATDEHGNDSSTKGFTVTVQDTTAPDIASHGDETVEATSSLGAVATYAAPATSDIVDGPGTATCSPVSGAQFALGNTTVTCDATDGAGNAATSTTFVVHIVDTTAPVIASHAPVVAEATGPTGAVVSYTAPGTSDVVDGAGTATCLPASGSTFAIATATVTCNASDLAGNAATATSFTVTVQDTTAPAITPHADVLATATGGSAAVVTYTSPTWTDAVDGAGTASCAPPSGGSFPVGSTLITCSVTDSHNNTATSSFSVIVSYAFNGFFQPIDNLPAQNRAKAGSAIPVKFSLGGNQGLDIFRAGSPTSAAVTCGASAPDDIEATVTAGGSSLNYDSNANQYVYVWKTDSKWAGTCRQLVVVFRDGRTQRANFTFTK